MKNCQERTVALHVVKRASLCIRITFVGFLLVEAGGEAEIVLCMDDKKVQLLPNNCSFFLICFGIWIFDDI